MPTRVVDLAEGLADLGDGATLSDDALVAAVREAGELRRWADAIGARLSATLASRCAVKEPSSPDVQRGFRSPEALIASEAALEVRDASAWTRVGSAGAERIALTGEVLPAAHPLVAEAIAAGRLTLAAADRIVATLDGASAHTDPEQLARFEKTLVAAAPGLTGRELKIACRRVVDYLDPDGIEPTEDDLRRRSSLTVCQQDDGMTRITALLHPEAAGFVLTALDARTAPRRSITFTDDPMLASDENAEDRRTLARRRADALVGIARDALTLDPGRVAGAPVTVLVTMTLDQLQGATGAARIAGVDHPVSAGTARRLAASGELIPLVLGGRSEILDQGAASRLATPAQRRALAFRDEGCIWGCGAPPGWCDVAHRVPWALTHRTDLDDLALMCPFHHWLYDHEGWTLRREGNARWLIPPPHVDPRGTPRRAGPPAAVA